MGEQQLLDQLIGKRGLAGILGWNVAHFRPAMVKDDNSATGYSWRTAVQGNGEGFPDLVLVKECSEYARCIYVELKGDKPLPSPAQVTWLDLLARVEGSEVYLWRPGDFEEIREILVMSHKPNLIERANFRSAWVNQIETREKVLCNISKTSR